VKIVSMHHFYFQCLPR